MNSPEPPEVKTHRRRRRKEDLVGPLTVLSIVLFLVLCVLSFGVLKSASSASHAAHKADRASQEANSAAKRAEMNSLRITIAEKAFCGRLQRVRGATNQFGAIVFVVLGAAARESGSKQYELIANLASYNPPTDCKKAIADPENYESPPPVPMSSLSRARINKILSTGFDQPT